MPCKATGHGCVFRPTASSSAHAREYSVRRPPKLKLKRSADSALQAQPSPHYCLRLIAERALCSNGHHHTMIGRYRWTELKIDRSIDRYTDRSVYHRVDR